MPYCCFSSRHPDVFGIVLASHACYSVVAVGHLSCLEISCTEWPPRFLVCMTGLKVGSGLKRTFNRCNQAPRQAARSQTYPSLGLVGRGVRGWPSRRQPPGFSGSSTAPQRPLPVQGFRLSGVGNRPNLRALGNSEPWRGRSGMHPFQEGSVLTSSGSAPSTADNWRSTRPEHLPTRMRYQSLATTGLSGEIPIQTCQEKKARGWVTAHRLGLR